MHVSINQTEIDRILAFLIGDLSEQTICSEDFPRYQFVDLLRATEAVQAQHVFVRHIESGHTEHSFTELFSGNAYGTSLNVPVQQQCPVDYQEDVFLPADGFRVIESADGSTRAVIRTAYAKHRTIMEVASTDAEFAKRLFNDIKETARKNSIYRGKCIELQFERAINVDGDISFEDEFAVEFKSRTEVSKDDIILETSVQQVIERNVIDFHNRRDELARMGLPKKRGLLFYGPPGTGKTFTCKHIASRLPGVTLIFAIGDSLLHIKSICNVARMLQPSIIVMEDVDLVFSQREANPNVTVLGSLLDELDGVSDDDEIIFILTTNAIERIEAAVRDRPGRISQCVPINAPSPPLRERYFRRLLRDYETQDIDLDQLVTKTEGATQAFIKGFVFRALQISTENGRSANGEVMLRDDDFKIALEEMTAGAGKHSLSIIGFR